MNHRHPLTASAVALALGIAASPSLALTWAYFDAAGYDPDGVPNTLVTARLPAELLADIAARLPEGLDINKNKDAKKLLTDNLGANIHLLEDAEITVIAVGGRTDYANSLGFFSYPTADAPKSTTGLNTRILFPNVAAMAAGQAVKLGKFKAGTSLGFVNVANGWQHGHVNPNQAANEIFYTIRALNPETPSTDGNSHLNAHTVLLSSSEDRLLVLGFEDAYRHPGNQDKTKPQRSDDDFNDVLIAIRVSAVGKTEDEDKDDDDTGDDNHDGDGDGDDSKVDLTGIATLDPVPKDSDGDSIIDELDAFPLDPARAARRFYPNAAGFGFLAFEDLWPKKGDFDMNDLLVAYRTVETLNAQNEIVDLKLIYEIRARGAGSDNGFGIHFPGLHADTIDPARTTLTIRDQAPVALPVESGQSEVVFIFSNNVTPLTGTGQAFPCSMMNTVMKCGRTAPVPLEANIHFKTPVTHAQLGAAPFNPFIYRTGKRGLEVHLVDHPPTAKVDPKLFGTLDDRSEPSRGRYYRTADNQPWVLDVPETWRHPTEWNSIAGAYPNFATWAAGGGTTAQDWYVSKVVGALTFTP